MGKSNLENRTLNKLHYVFIAAAVFILAACTNDASTEVSTSSEDTLVSVELEEENPNQGLLYWRWVNDDFNQEEKTKLKAWIQEVYDATMITLGVYEFDVFVYFHRSESDYSPVPFGYTSRKEGDNQVHFYVNPTASLDELLEDWTAPHELSHLSVPFLGKPSKWFSEGFATFLSRQTMIEMGYYTDASFDSLYFSKIDDNRPAYLSSTKTFIEVSDSLVSKGRYGPMYWGGTSFFMTIDLRMRAEMNKRFIEIIQDYQSCCRLTDKNLKQVISSFDKILGETWCRDLLDIYREQPSYEALKQLDNERRD